MVETETQGLDYPVTAYLGLGSNLDQPEDQIRAAFRELNEIPDGRCIRRSSLYVSSPVGPVNQPDFINAVAAVETRLSAQALLENLQHIEQRHGRHRRGERWGPRTLDLDILLYGQQRIRTACLTVPHPELHKRAFVLYPLLEISPRDLYIPGRGSLRELTKGCPKDGIKQLSWNGETPKRAAPVY